MKQYISVEQLNELTPEQKDKLREWWKPQEGDLFLYTEKIIDITYEKVGIYLEGEFRSCFEPDSESLPLLSIGLIIELLITHNKYFEIRYITDYYVFYDQDNNDTKSTALIDALWLAVKDVL